MPSWPWTFATLPAGNVAASKLDDNFNAAMFAAGSSTDGAVPTWNGTGGNTLNTGGLVVGTAANNLVQLDGSGLLPTSVIPTGGYTVFAAGYWDGSLYQDKNVASVSNYSTGLYRVTFTTPNVDEKYIVLAVPRTNGQTNRYFQLYAQTSSYFDMSSSGDNVGSQNVTAFSFIVYLLS